MHAEGVTLPDHSEPPMGNGALIAVARFTHSREEGIEALSKEQLQKNSKYPPRVHKLIRLVKELLKDKGGIGDCDHCSASTTGNQNLNQVKHDSDCLIRRLRESIRDITKPWNN